MSIKYQTLLGDTSGDLTNLSIYDLDAANATFQNLILPNGAEKGYVWTSDDQGFGQWVMIPAITLAGDAVGAPGSNVVNTLAGGTIPVSNIVQLAATQTLTNKTLTAPQISNIQNGLLTNLTVPSNMVDTFVCRNTIDTLTNKTLTLPIINKISNGGTVTIPSGTDTLVTLTASQTLSNKTLIAPNISTLVNGGGTLNLPGTLMGDTIVARNTADTLTNKTLTLPVISSISNGGTVLIPSGADTLVTLTAAQVLTNKSLTLPVISSISNGGTITIPTGADALVTLTAKQTMINKTLTTPVISSILNNGLLTLPTSPDTLVGQATADTLQNKTITGTTNSVDANTLRYGSTYAVPLAGTAPATNNVLSYNGTSAVWLAPVATSSVTMGGDLSGSSSSAVVNTLANGTILVSSVATLTGS